jgi:phosphatidylinositol-4,5-bisphosphate 3-kinase catalytic subunit alpha/beta/delta
MIDQGQFNLTDNTLYSGECDWPFKVKLVGITNIYRLLILDDKDSDELKAKPKRRATYNGICPIRVITKESAK